MKRPGIQTYLIGNPVSCLAIVGASLYAAYQWFTHQDTMPWLVPVIAWVTASWALSANKAIRDFKAWRRDWEMLGGGDAAPSRMSFRTFRQAAGFGIYLAMAAWLALRERSTPDYGAVAGIFGLCTLGLAVRFVQWMRRRRRTAETSSSGEFLTEQCLPCAIDQPWLAQAPLHVPSYCQRLLNNELGDRSR